MPSESETYKPLDPPDNESDTSDVESEPSNLDAEQEEELMRSEPRRLTRCDKIQASIPPSVAVPLQVTIGKYTMVEDESSRSRVQGQEVHKPRIEHLSGFTDRSARGLRVRDSHLDKLSKLR